MRTNTAIKKKPNNIGRWITGLTPKQRSDLIQRATRAQWGPRKEPPKKADDGPWTWPIDIERYDRSPILTPVEKETLTRMQSRTGFTATAARWTSGLLLIDSFGL